MSEEEIIKQVKDDMEFGEFYGITEDAIQGLLDLYNKQKETIKSLETENKALKELYSGTQEFKDVCKWLEE